MRWLLFDVGGVLEVTDDASWPLAFTRRWALRLNLTVTEYQARLESAELPDAGIRSGVEEEFWRGYAAAVGASAIQLHMMRADYWDAYCGQVNTELLDLARSLVGQVGLAILSNSGDGARREEERRFGFSAMFDPICYSHEIGVAKPDPEAFRIALHAMNADADEVLFIDDIQANIAGAGVKGCKRCSTSRTRRPPRRSRNSEAGTWSRL